MKGISEVIALILMLVITIALAGTAYLYISGIFTTQTQAIEVADAYCNSSSHVIMTIRNLGSSPITSVSCTRSAPTTGGCTVGFTQNVGFFPISPGNATTFSNGIDLCPGSGTARTCAYRLSGSVGRTITTQVTCTS